MKHGLLILGPEINNYLGCAEFITVGLRMWEYLAWNIFPKIRFLFTP